VPADPRADRGELVRALARGRRSDRLRRRLVTPRERALDQLEPFAPGAPEREPPGGQPPVDAESPERLRERPEAVSGERRFLEALVRCEVVHLSFELRQQVSR
jgi:hypothetical protein